MSTGQWEPKCLNQTMQLGDPKDSSVRQDFVFVRFPVEVFYWLYTCNGHWFFLSFSSWQETLGHWAVLKAMFDLPCARLQLLSFNCDSGTSIKRMQSHHGTDALHRGSTFLEAQVLQTWSMLTPWTKALVLQRWPIQPRSMLGYWSIQLWRYLHLDAFLYCKLNSSWHSVEGINFISDLNLFLLVLVLQRSGNCSLQ